MATPSVPSSHSGKVPSQQLWVVRQHPDTGQRSLDVLQWGLIPYWCKDKPEPTPTNAEAEPVDRLPMFREAYRKRAASCRSIGYSVDGPDGDLQVEPLPMHLSRVVERKPGRRRMHGGASRGAPKGEENGNYRHHQLRRELNEWARFMEKFAEEVE